MSGEERKGARNQRFEIGDSIEGLLSSMRILNELKTSVSFNPNKAQEIVSQTLRPWVNERLKELDNTNNTLRILKIVQERLRAEGLDDSRELMRSAYLINLTFDCVERGLENPDSPENAAVWHDFTWGMFYASVIVACGGIDGTNSLLELVEAIELEGRGFKEKGFTENMQPEFVLAGAMAGMSLASVLEQADKAHEKRALKRKLASITAIGLLSVGICFLTLEAVAINGRNSFNHHMEITSGMLTEIASYPTVTSTPTVTPGSSRSTPTPRSSRR